MKPIDGLFQGRLVVLNIGLEQFAEALVSCGADALQVDWRPPAGGDANLLAALDEIRGRPAAPDQTPRDVNPGSGRPRPGAEA